MNFGVYSAITPSMMKYIDHIIMQHISRSEELISSIGHLLTTKATADVFFCSQSVGLLKILAYWHQLR